MSFEEAVREQLPVVVSLAGQSGSGKTLSALLMARGLAGPEGKIGVIDSENRRTRAYVGRPDVGPFVVKDLYAPFTPEAYVKAIDAAEAAVLDVLVIDSASHEWTGTGGLLEIADQMDPGGKKGPLVWGKLKPRHRRLVNRILMAQCHVIVCLRAHKKLIATKDAEGKQQFAESERPVAEQEKNFPYEMTLSAVLDETTHLPHYTKLPDPLLGAIEGGRLIGIDTGAAIREWVMGGMPVDKEAERALASLRDIAGWKGRAGLEAHWKSHIPASLRKRLAPHMKAIGEIADEADRNAAEAAAEADAEPEHPIDGDGSELDLG